MLNIMGRKYSQHITPNTISYSALLDYTTCQRLYVYNKLLKLPCEVSTHMKVGQAVAAIMLKPVAIVLSGDTNEIQSAELEQAILNTIAPNLNIGQYTLEQTFTKVIVDNPVITLKGILDGRNADTKTFVEFKYTGDKRGLGAFSSIPLTYQLATYFYLTNDERAKVICIKRPYIAGLLKQFTRVEALLAHFAESSAKRPGLYMASQDYIREEFERYYPYLVPMYTQVMRDVYMKLKYGWEFLPSPTNCATCPQRTVCETGIIPVTEVLEAIL